MTGALSLAYIPCRTFGRRGIGLAQNFQCTIERAVTNRAMRFARKRLVVKFNVCARGAFEGFSKAHGSHGDVGFFVSSGTNENKSGTAAGSRQRSCELRNEMIIQTEAGAKRDVRLKEIGPTDESVEGEHPCIGVSRQHPVLPYWIFRNELGNQFAREETEESV